MGFIEKLSGACHVGYVVEDVDRCLKELQEKFCCCEHVTPYFFAPQRAWSCGVPIENCVLKIAKCYMRDDLIMMEYIQPISKSGFHALSLIGNGDNLNHIAFNTDHYDECHSEFEKLGACFVFEAETNDIQNGYRRCAYAKLQHIPGLIEILENTKPYQENL